MQTINFLWHPGCCKTVPLYARFRWQRMVHPNKRLGYQIVDESHGQRTERRIPRNLHIIEVQNQQRYHRELHCEGQGRDTRALGCEART